MPFIFAEPNQMASKQSKEEKEKWVEHLTLLYNKFSHLPSDTQKFQAIIEETKGAVSLRTLKTYKAKYRWGGGDQGSFKSYYKKTLKSSLTITNNPERPEFKNKKVRLPKFNPKAIENSERPLAITDLQITDTNPTGTGARKRGRPAKDDSELSEFNRSLLVTKICNSYSSGMVSIYDLCDDYSVNYMDLMKWVSTNEAYYLRWQDAKKLNSINSLNRIEEGLKMNLMSLVANNKVEEIHTTYEAVEELVDGQLVIKHKEIGRKVVVKPNRYDSKTMDFLWSMLKETRASFIQSNQMDIDISDNMSIEELEDAIRLEKEKLQFERGEIKDSEEE